MEQHTFLTTLSEAELRAIVKDAIASFYKIFTLANETAKIKPLSRKEAAAFLKISLPTLDKYTRTGKLIASRLGRKKIYTIDSLNKSLHSLNIKTPKL